MADVVGLTFNPFQENTYLVYDKTGACIIIDPGCMQEAEKALLKQTISDQGLKPQRLINTHCHIDHIFGNRFVADTYDLKLEIHEGEKAMVDAVPDIASMYGLPQPDPTPELGDFLPGSGLLEFGETQLQVLFTPGHSPASISFFAEADQFLIAGDVLFRDSIGRTDLPGGDHQTLLDSIRQQYWILPENTTVYPGHGPTTTIGYEKANNPFLQ